MPPECSQYEDGTSCTAGVDCVPPSAHVITACNCDCQMAKDEAAAGHPIKLPAPKVRNVWLAASFEWDNNI